MISRFYVSLYLILEFFLQSLCLKSMCLYFTALIYTYVTLIFNQVSETENIRKNLAIERMMIEGCDILLDVNQVFVRQGTLIQLLQSHSRGSSSSKGTGSKSSKEREAVRQCFLFSNHLIVTTR